MTQSAFVLATVAALALAGCQREATAPVAPPVEAPAATSAPAPAPTVATAATPDAAPPSADDTAAPKEMTEEEKARAKQQAKLDFATMEDGYINDSKGQWAVSAKASSAVGDANDPAKEQDRWGTPWQATGVVNDKEWLSASTDVGFDWLELEYERPVSASAVRVVLGDGKGVESITRLALIDTTGKSHDIWSGLSDAKEDERGERTWFIKTFEPTSYQVKAVKLTFAKNIQSSTHVDAVQLIGE